MQHDVARNTIRGSVHCPVCALQIEESALDWLAGAGYDPVYGARPVKRAIQRDLETPLARALLMGAFQEDDTVVVGT
jgi:ATP-dependent Clp protease ATP-binding subunit ClpB